MRLKFRKTPALLMIIIMLFIILPKVHAGRVYYQEFSILANEELIISFEPSFLNYTVLVAPVGNLKYSVTHSPNELHFIAHDNGTYIIRVSGTDVYNDSLVLVYVVTAFGEIVLPPPPAFSLSSEITTVVNKTVILNYPELSNLNVTVTPEKGFEIKTETSTSTEILFKEIGRYSVSITGTTKEGSDYSLNVTVDVVNVVNVNVTKEEVKVVTYSIPQWQAILYLCLGMVPLFAVLAFMYRRSVSLENVLRGVLSNEPSGRNPGENQTNMGEGNS